MPRPAKTAIIELLTNQRMHKKATEDPHQPKTQEERLQHTGKLDNNKK
jgi:hypothetical protein